MKRIARPAIDAELAREHAERSTEMLEAILPRARRDAQALDELVNWSWIGAGAYAAVAPESPAIGRALRIGAGASAAIFALATGSGEIDVPLGDDAPARLNATGPTAASHAANWRHGFYMALLAADDDAASTLTQVPIDVLRQSSTRGDDCVYLFVEALQAWHRRDAAVAERLHLAVQATEPARLTRSPEEFVLNVLVPEMELLHRLLDGAIAPFNETLGFAVERHRKYWTKGDRKRDPRGFLALGPSVFTAAARRAGMPIDIESDYLLHG